MTELKKDRDASRLRGGERAKSQHIKGRDHRASDDVNWPRVIKRWRTWMNEMYAEEDT
jgi:hypothetical protein